MDNYIQLGVGGTFALVVIKIVLDHLKNRKNGNTNNSNNVGNSIHLQSEIKDLKDDVKELTKKLEEVRKDLRSEIKDVDGKRNIDVQLLKEMLTKAEMKFKDFQMNLAMTYVSKIQCKSDQQEYDNRIEKLNKKVNDE